MKEYLLVLFILTSSRRDEADLYPWLMWEAEQERSQGLLYKHLCNSFIHCFSHPLVKIYLRRCHAQTVKNGASSDKTSYIDILPEILNHKRHKNRWIGSKVKTILLNGWILPTGGGVLGRVCACSRGARVLERCDISRSIYGILSSPRGARNIEKCDISRSICGISNTPRRLRRLGWFWTGLRWFFVVVLGFGPF